MFKVKTNQCNLLNIAILQMRK